MGTTRTLAQRMKPSLLPALVTIPGQNPNRALVSKATLSNNRGKQALPDTTSLASQQEVRYFTGLRLPGFTGLNRLDDALSLEPRSVSLQ